MSPRCSAVAASLLVDASVSLGGSGTSSLEGDVPFAAVAAVAAEEDLCACDDVDVHRPSLVWDIRKARAGRSVFTALAPTRAGGEATGSCLEEREPPGTCRGDGDVDLVGGAVPGRGVDEAT